MISVGENAPVDLAVFTAEEEQIIKSKDTCVLATVGKDGWPHCVPVGYVYKDGVFYIPSSKKSRKVLNLRVSKRACIVIHDEKDEKGVMIRGYPEIVEGKEFVPLKHWMQSLTGWSIGEAGDTVIIIIKPIRKTSWRLKQT
jgi:general stress protein 26